MNRFSWFFAVVLLAVGMFRTDVANASLCDEVVAWAGSTTVNSYDDPTSASWGIECRGPLSESVHVSFMILNEGNPKDWFKRDGIAVRLLGSLYRGERSELNLGGGLYAAASTIKLPDTSGQSYRDEHDMLGLATVEGRYHLTGKTTLSLAWHRVFGSNKHYEYLDAYGKKGIDLGTDVDLFHIGLGYKF